MSENNKEIIRHTIDKLSPSEEQSSKMWERLSQTIVLKEEVVSIDDIRNNKVKKISNIKKKIVTVAASIMLIILAGIGANKLTGGKVYAAVEEWVSVFQGKQDVAGNIEESYDKNNTVYAPEIYYIDDEILIFGDTRGAVVYDSKMDCVKATIDTQKIGCVYFEGDTKCSHIVKEDNMVIVFNSEGDAPIGNFYSFDLGQADGGELILYETGQDNNKLEEYYKIWLLNEKNYSNTFERYVDNEEILELFSVDSENLYSEHCFGWTDKKGNTCNSFILFSEGRTYLYTEIEDFDSVSAKELNLDTNDASEQEGVYLSGFIYTGDNGKIKAIYEYMKDEYNMFIEDNQICIPGYVIYKEVEEADEILVFGNFWAYGYQLEGAILEAQSGYEMPACFHLKKDGDEYSVITVDRASDGSYMEDIQNFTSGYPDVYDMFLTVDNDQRIEAMRVFVEMYVSDNNLDVAYFAEYGMDPLMIFSE